MPPSIRDLTADRIIVCDGAMGTMILSKGVPLGSSFDEVNVTQPAIVEEIHRAYLDAGAEIIETNTFGANRLKLESYGLGPNVREINIAGAMLARKCAGDLALVAGAIGPTGRVMQPFGPLDFDEAFDVYREQVCALCEGGVDLLIIETIQDLREAKAALLAAKGCTEIPIVCQMSFSQEGKTMMGTSPEVAAAVLSAMGVWLVGANCSTGPQDMLDVIRAMAGVTDLGLSAQPNAGLPRFHDGRLIYLSTPDYMADYARQFAEAGAVLVGGCCGTTPDHIRAMAAAVSGMKPAKHTAPEMLRVASRTKLFEIGAGRPVIVGSRLSAPASTEVESDIREGHFKLVQDEAGEQFRHGAEIICIDCDLAGEHNAKRLVELVQTASSGALCLVGSDARVLEEAVRAVEGRAFLMLRDSIGAVIESLLPLAKTHGAAVIARTDVENGEGSAAERLRVAARIVQAAGQLGMREGGIAVHCGDVSDENSIHAVRLVKSDLKVPVVVEASGADCGEFLRSALEAGADIIIADPLDPAVRVAVGKSGK